MSRARKTISSAAETVHAPGWVGVALVALVVGGLALRLGLVVQWRPAFVNYSDSGIYFQGANTSIWVDPIRTVGYSLFLKLLNGVVPGLLAVIVIQHLLGMATAVILFVTMRIGGAPAWVALLSAAVLLLGGFEVMIEHAALSEGIYIPLLMLTLFACVKSWNDGSLAWAGVAGLTAGLGIAVKGAATAMVPVLAACLLFPGRRPLLRRLAAAAVVVGVTGAVLAVYVGERTHRTGQGGLVSNGAWNFYGRVAPWAECDKFKPPPGTEVLCEKTPLSARGFRRGDDYYIFNPDSPAQKFAGPPYLLSSNPEAMATLQRFSRAAILGEPSAYLNAVARDMARVVDPEVESYSQFSPDDFRTFLVYGPGVIYGTGGLGDGSGPGNAFVDYWQRRLYPGESRRQGNIAFFLWWDRVTTPVGPLMALALLLALLAPFVVPGRSRFLAVLMTASAYTLIVFPILSKSYDFRFVIPAVGPLAAASLLGLWGAGLKVQTALHRRGLKNLGSVTGGTTKV